MRCGEGVRIVHGRGRGGGDDGFRWKGPSLISAHAMALKSLPVGNTGDHMTRILSR